MKEMCRVEQMWDTGHQGYMTPVVVLNSLRMPHTSSFQLFADSGLGDLRLPANYKLMAKPMSRLRRVTVSTGPL